VNDRLHVGDTANAVWVSACPIKTEGGTPIMDDKYYLLSRFD